MIQKGFDNVVMLTGGLRSFAEKYPHRIVGELPQEWKETPDKQNMKSSFRSKNNNNSNNLIPPKTGQSNTSSRIGSSPKSVKSGLSLHTNTQESGRISPRTRLRQQQLTNNNSKKS